MLRASIRICLVLLAVACSRAVTFADVFLLGDSTVADVTDPLFGWGEVLPFYMPDDTIHNLASSGASSRSYYAQYWTNVGWPFSETAQQMVGLGDLVLIQFGHNDIPSGPPDAFVQTLDEYKSWLTLIVNETRDEGSLPVLVTPPEGWRHRPSGPIVQRQGHADAMKEVATETNTPVIDLHAHSVQQFQIRTEEQAIIDFEAINPETNQPIGDKTHTSRRGAEHWAQFIAAEFPNAVSAAIANNPGDYNLDGEVTLGDFLILADNFQQEFPISESFMRGDSNVDGTIDLRDFLAFRRSFRAASNTAAQTSGVPELSSASLAMIALLASGLLRQRRR